MRCFFYFVLISFAVNLFADHYCICETGKYNSYNLIFVQTEDKTGEILKKHILKSFSPRDGFDENIFEKSVKKRCYSALKKHPSCS
jgi:hypothetical protein